MKTLLLLCTLGTVLMFSSCKKDQDLNDCIQDKIDQFILDAGDDTLRRIDQYTFQNQLVFAFDEGSVVDGQILVYDGECNQLCALNGLLGIVDCNGEIFFDVATDRVTIWEP